MLGVDAEIDLGPEGNAIVSLPGIERATAQGLVEAPLLGVSLFASNAREHRRRNDRSEADTPWHYRGVDVEELKMNRPALPPFTAESAAQKVRMAEDAWNTRDCARVVLAYTPDCRWRNRVEFMQGRAEIEAFLTRKWSRELDYRLIKELWAFRENRIAVRFAYEWRDDSGHWFRSYGNENWEFDENGLMRVRIASINDLPIGENERKYHWPLGRRPDDHPSLSELGL